ncbi:GTPase IMAP family member 7-like [Etheostoma spectabile]|uniref:GTPase IMAP family member 7-like n=1 Tax=Etheostoma spectabile TaxID=54343 RepID=UPI0013AF3DC9|nr:GTPase IMAP family member 7-like [Etheostoma spectabile]
MLCNCSVFYKQTSTETTAKIAALPRQNGDQKELRIVLLGSVRAGKSFSGNKILGDDNLFPSRRDMSAVTKRCQKEQEVIDNQTVVVVDTPGLLNANKKEAEIMTEIQTSIGLCKPGPHVFLFVLNTSERYTVDMEDKVKSIFGENALDYTMVLFNVKDNEFNCKEDYIGDEENLKDHLKKCKYGDYFFDRSTDQVPELLTKINDQVKEANGRYYTAEMLQEHVEQLKNAKTGQTIPRSY